jgi:hypothetical protein
MLGFYASAVVLDTTREFGRVRTLICEENIDQYEIKRPIEESVYFEDSLMK